MFSGGLYGNLPGAKDDQPNKPETSTTPWASASAKGTPANRPFMPTTLRSTTQTRRDTGPAINKTRTPRASGEAHQLTPVTANEAAILGIQDEYDPARPNDYTEVRNRRELLRREAEEEAERQERIKELKRREDFETRREERPKIEEDGPGRRIAKHEPTGGSEKGMGLAQKMMEKMGWRAGQGLGRNEQGIAAPLAMQKTDVNAGVIVVQQQHLPATSRVILLENMVGPGQVDESLDEEVGQECSKYGEVTNVLIFEVIEVGYPDEKAVRIFVEFDSHSAAAKAVSDLDGRYFGGRSVQATFFGAHKFESNDLAP